MIEEARKALAKLQQKFHSEKWVDAQIYYYRRDELSIAFGSDLVYSHSAELVFERPLFFSGPFSWSTSPDRKPIVQLLTSKETKQLAEKYLIEMPSLMLRFSDDDERDILAVSVAVSTKLEVVYYYKRENLGPGERVAYWL
jgi:hypothetical protein